MNNISIELVLGAWGALISTIVAIFEIFKAITEKPSVSISVHSINLPISEKTEPFGIKAQVHRGDDLQFEDIYFEMVIRNKGRVATQITCFYRETDKFIQELTPSGLPIVLEPNTSYTIKLHPEYFVDPSFQHNEKGERLLPPKIEYSPVISAGIIDALGKKYKIKRKQLQELFGDCSQMPLRYGIFQHKTTENYVIALQIKDAGRLIGKSS